MKTTRLKLKKCRIPLSSLFLLFSINVMAQPGLNIFAELGSNNVSHGLFIMSSTLGFFKLGKNTFGAGVQTDLKNNNIEGFSGYRFDASRNFIIRDISIGIEGFYTTTISSEVIRESNLGGLIRMEFTHFDLTLGTNLRTFSLRQGFMKGYNIEKKNSRIHETSNLMYSFSYNLKPAENRWNVGITLTNFDLFTIYQETNPMINLHGSYKIKPQVNLYTQLWYKISGASNLEVNYFGFYLKTGIIWNF